MAQKRAVIEGGITLEFPEDTPQAIMDAEVASFIKSQNPFSDVKGGGSSTASAFSGVKGGSSSTAKPAIGVGPNWTAEQEAQRISRIKEPVTEGGEGAPGLTTGQLKLGGSIAAGIAAPAFLPVTAGPLAATLASALGMTGFDQLASAATGGENTSLTGNVMGVENPLVDAGLEVGENLAAAGAIGKIGRGLYKSVKAGSQPVINQSLLGLEPTIGQLAPESPIQAILKPVANFLEGAFAPEAKALAAQRSAGLVKERAEAFIERETGRKVKLDTLRNDTGRQAVETTEAYRNSLTRSQNARAKAVELAEIPQRNVAVGTYDTGMVDDAGQPILKPFAVKGGIPVVRSGMAAEEFYTGVARGTIPLPPDHPMVRLAQTMMAESANGAKPITFSQAVKNLESLEEIIKNSGSAVEVTAFPKFYKLFSALEKDLMGNIDKLPVNASGVKANLLDVIGTTKQRIRLFRPGGSATRNTRISMNNLDSAGAVIEDATTQIRKQILDPHQRKRFLERGRLDLQAPLANGKMQLVPVDFPTQAKRDAGAFLLGDILDQSMQVPDRNFATGNKLFDAEKAAALTRDPYVASAMGDLFNSKQQEGFKLLLKDLEAINHQKSPLDNKWMRYVGTGVFSLGAGLAAYMNGSSPSRSLQIAGAAAGLGIGAAGLGRIMTNPKAARVFHSMMNGADIGMPRMAAFQILKESLIGEKVTITSPDGKSEEVIVTKDGYKPVEE